MHLAKEIKKGKLKAGQIEALERLFQQALEDGRISTKEITQIQLFYYDSELSEKDFSSLKDGVFRDVVQAAIADEQVTEHERKSIMRITKQLNISDESREWALSQVEKYYAAHPGMSASHDKE